MESLRNSGFGGAKMYTAEELRNLSPDDMAKKVLIHALRKISSNLKAFYYHRV